MIATYDSKNHAEKSNWGDRRFYPKVTGYVPSIIIAFDDSDQTDYEAFKYMKAKNIPGVSFVITNKVGWPNNTSLAELIEMRDAGWDISMHTHTHVDLEAVTPEERAYEISTCKGWLDANGFSASSGYIAYPWGRADGITEELSGLGIIAGRGTLPGRFGEDGPDDQFMYPGGLGIHSTMTLESAIEYIDAMTKDRQNSFLYLHQLTDGIAEGVQWTYSDFFAVIDHVANYIRSGQIKATTFSKLDSFFKL